LENLDENDHLGDLGKDVRMILELILGKERSKMWTGCV